MVVRLNLLVCSDVCRCNFQSFCTVGALDSEFISESAVDVEHQLLAERSLFSVALRKLFSLKEQRKDSFVCS